MTAGKQLLSAASRVFASRRKTYGDVKQLSEIVAQRWSTVLGTKVTAAQVNLCLIDLKLARLIKDPAHQDTQIDIAGYAACLAEVTANEDVAHVKPDPKPKPKAKTTMPASKQKLATKADEKKAA